MKTGQKQELPLLICMPSIYTLVHEFAVFSTQTRLHLGPNPSDSIQNGIWIK